MRSVAIAVFMCGLVAGTASANVLYSQPSDQPDQPSFFSDAVSGQFFRQRMADNFSLQSASLITGIRWWGGSQNFQVPDVSNMASWTLWLYADDGSGNVDLNTEINLGTYIFSQTNAVATGHALFGGGIEYQQEISFDALALASGNYWVSIGATLEVPAGDAWVWAGSSVGDLVNATDFFTGSGFTTFDPTFNDLAFEVLGVPAPASVTPLAACIALLRRRR